MSALKALAEKDSFFDYDDKFFSEGENEWVTFDDDKWFLEDQGNTFIVCLNKKNAKPVQFKKLDVAAQYAKDLVCEINT